LLTSLIGAPVLLDQPQQHFPRWWEKVRRKNSGLVDIN
jgi:hypothetical protein